MIIFDILLLILLLIGILLMAILITPFTLYINTVNSLYYFEIKNIIKLRVIMFNGMPILLISCFFFKFRFDPIKKRWKKKENKKKPKKKKKSKNIGFRFIKDLINSVIKSFNVRKILINIDTGNYYYNGILSAFFNNIRLLNSKVCINYDSNNVCILHLQNSIIKLIYIVLKAFLFLKIKNKK